MYKCRCYFPFCSYKDKDENDEVINYFDDKDNNERHSLERNKNKMEPILISNLKESSKRNSTINNFNLSIQHDNEKNEIEKETKKNNQNQIQQCEHFCFIINKPPEKLEEKPKEKKENIPSKKNQSGSKSSNSMSKTTYDTIKSIKISKLYCNQKITIKESKNNFEDEYK